MNNRFRIVPSKITTEINDALDNPATLDTPNFLTNLETYLHTLNNLLIKSHSTQTKHLLLKIAIEDLKPEQALACLTAANSNKCAVLILEIMKITNLYAELSKKINSEKNQHKFFDNSPDNKKEIVVSNDLSNSFR